MVFGRRYGEPEWEANPVEVNGIGIETKIKNNRSYEEARLESWSNDFTNQFLRLNHKSLTTDKGATFVNLMNLTETVNIIVGGSTARWIVHKNLLVNSSEFAWAALIHDSKEAQEGTIRLPEEQPKTFDHYVKFLYTGCILTFSLEEILQMYFLGERLQASKFRQACLDAVSKSESIYKAQSIKDVFDNTTSRDPLRKLCIEQIGRGTIQGIYKFALEAERTLLAPYMPDLMLGVVAAVAAEKQKQEQAQTINLDVNEIPSEANRPLSFANNPAASYIQIPQQTTSNPFINPLGDSTRNLFGNPGGTFPQQNLSAAANNATQTLFPPPVATSGATCGLFGTPFKGYQAPLGKPPVTNSLFGQPVQPQSGTSFSTPSIFGHTNNITPPNPPSQNNIAGAGTQVFGAARSLFSGLGTQNVQTPFSQHNSPTVEPQSQARSTVCLCSSRHSPGERICRTQFPNYQPNDTVSNNITIPHHDTATTQFVQTTNPIREKQENTNPVANEAVSSENDVQNDIENDFVTITNEASKDNSKGEERA